MANSKKEGEIVNELLITLKEKGFKCQKNINFGKIVKMGLFKMKKRRYHPLRPQIDILCYDRQQNKLHAIEVKYFRYTGLKNTNYAKVIAYLLENKYINETEFKEKYLDEILQMTPNTYYSGIDESLSLLNFGVDYAWLYHVIDIPWKYAYWTKWTKNILELTPVGYKVLGYKNDTLEENILKEAAQNPILKHNSPVINEIRSALIKSFTEDSNLKNR